MSEDVKGVFVRLPLSEEQVKTLEYRLEGYNSALLAIGTPITGGELYPIGYINEDAIGGLATGVYQSASIFRDEDVEHHDTVALTRQSDALAKLAERDAEIARLRDLLERLRDVVSRGMTQSVPLPGQQYPIGSHHHPIWVEIANALKGPEA